MNMDECPRCHAPLSRLSLGDVSTIACNECSFANIPADLHPEWEERESWREAFDRFYEQSAVTD